MRAELPVEQGMFPAFWLMPKASVWPPEIDIMENVGENWVSGGAIAPNDHDAFRTFFPEGLKGDHSYGLLWTKQSITWYVDGKAVGSIPTPASMHQPMYLLVNLAVGGDWAGRPAADFDSAVMKVDYVRAYSLDQGTSPPPPPQAPSPPPPPAAPSPPPPPPPVPDPDPDPDGAVVSAVTMTLDATTVRLVLSGTDAIDGAGNKLDNILSGNEGSNRLVGGNGDDRLYGKGGNDELLGGNDDDLLNGGAGADTMTGGGGNDLFVVDSAADRVVELTGGGQDRVMSSVSTTLAAEVENLSLAGTAAINGTGNGEDNIIAGNSAANVLSGLAGNDKLIGGGGNDVIIGGQGNDLLSGGDGVDRFVFTAGFGDDRISDFGAGGADVVDLSALIQAGIRPTLHDSPVGAVIAVSGGYSITLIGVDPHELNATGSGYVFDGN